MIAASVLSFITLTVALARMSRLNKDLRIKGSNALSDLEFKFRGLLLDEQKFRAFAENSARMRDELVAMVSHDLKNPLSSIILGAQLLDKGQFVTEAGKKLVARIELSAGRMQRMIQDLLDSHTIETGNFDLRVEKKECSVLSIVQRAIDSQQILAAQKSQSLEMIVPNYVPLVFLDSERVQQVFQNLIGNAIKFTPVGGSIRIKAEPADRDIVFSVSDTGPGISDELKPHIFERFSQDEATAKSGTGLGLSIAKAVVEAHGGRVWIESYVGIGSTFFFSIPIAA